MEAAPRLVHHFLEGSAALFPEKTALVYGKRRAAFSDIDRRANALASGLVRSGLGPGDRVVLLSENSVEYAVGYYGILKAGGIVASLDTDTKPGGLARIVMDLEPKAFVVSRRHEKTVRALDASVSGEVPVVVLGREPATGADDGPRPAIDPAACAAIVYTSGSAGKPKGVMLSHANIVANTGAIVGYLGLTPDDIQMAVLPFSYVMGMSLLNTHIAVGGTVVINNKFAYTAAVLKQMAEEGVTGFSGVPSTYAHLLFRSPLAAYRDRLPRLRYCSQAGGHMPGQVKRGLLKALPPHVRFVVMYGATEASARLTYVPPDMLEAKIDSIGVPIPGVSIEVMSPDGRPLGPGEAGEIVARGKNIMLGYFRDEEATRTVLDAHGFHTGDLGYRDEDGYYYVTGRKDEQLKVGGRRLDPREVEDAIVESGLAVECLVFGVADPMQGTRLAGLVVPVERTDRTVEAILEHCAARLPRFKVPGSLRLVEALPKTGSGKPDRTRAARLFERTGGQGRRKRL